MRDVTCVTESDSTATLPTTFHSTWKTRRGQVRYTSGARHPPLLWDGGRVDDRLLYHCMSDPLSLVPFALSARAGHLDMHKTAQLVAAGITLLQRSAPLVRALSGRRAGIFLPTSSAFLTALAACDGRGALVVHPFATAFDIAWQLADADVGAVFTTAALAPLLPAEFPTVLVDECPQFATVRARLRSSRVELGTHYGLLLEGAGDVDGRDEECLVMYGSPLVGASMSVSLTHRDVLAMARATAIATAITPADKVLAVLPYSNPRGFIEAGVAPLLAGARVATMEQFHAGTALERIVQERITLLSGDANMFAALTEAIDFREGQFRNHALRACRWIGLPPSEAVADGFFAMTGVKLQSAD